MHLVIAFDGHEPRELPVTDLHTITVEDGATGELADKVALEGVRALFLVRTDGTSAAGGVFEQSSISPEEVARTIGWVPPQEKHDLEERVARLEQDVRDRDQAIERLNAEQARQAAQEQSQRGLFGRRQ